MRLMFIQSRFLPILLLVFLYLGNCLMMLFLGISPIHDAMVWLGVNNIFYTAIENGHLPLWNPYNQSGTHITDLQNFGLIEPLTFIFILFKKIFHLSSFNIYLFHYYSRFLIFLIGAYLTIYFLTQNRLSSFLFTLFLGMINYLNVFVQNGSINSCYLIPFMTFLVLKIFSVNKENVYYNLKLFFMFSVSFSVMLNIYIPAYLLYYFVIFILLMILFKDFEIKKIVFNPLNKITILMISGILLISLLFMLPLLAMFDLISFDSELFPTIRFLQKNGNNLINIYASDTTVNSIHDVFTGQKKVSLNIYNALSILLEPFVLNKSVVKNIMDTIPFINEIYISEVSIYLGLYPFLLIVFGFKNKVKYFYTFVSLAILILLIGCNFHVNQIHQPNFIQSALATLFPFLKMIEAYHLFGMIFTFLMIVAAAIQETHLNHKIKRRIALISIGFYSLRLAFFGSTYYFELFEDQVDPTRIAILMFSILMVMLFYFLLNKFILNHEFKRTNLQYVIVSVMTLDILLNIAIGVKNLPFSIYQYTNVNDDYFSKVKYEEKFNLYRQSFSTLIVPFNTLSNVFLNQYVLFPDLYMNYLDPLKLEEVNALNTNLFPGGQFLVSKDFAKYYSAPPYFFKMDLNNITRHLEHIYTAADFIQFLDQAIGIENSNKYRQQIANNLSLVPHTTDSLFMQKYYYDFLMKINYAKQLILGGVTNPILNFYPEDQTKFFADKYQVVQAINQSTDQEVRRTLFIEREIVKNEMDLTFDVLNDPTKYKLVKEEEYPKNSSFFALKPPNEKLNYEVVRYNLNNLTLNVEIAENGYLYYADGYSKHWRAFVDGKETEIFKTNINFKSVKLTKGRHTVEFQYSPTFFIAAYWGYFLGLLLFLPFYQWIRFYELKYSKAFTG